MDELTLRKLTVLRLRYRVAVLRAERFLKKAPQQNINLFPPEKRHEYFCFQGAITDAADALRQALSVALKAGIIKEKDIAAYWQADSLLKVRARQLLGGDRIA